MSHMKQTKTAKISMCVRPFVKGLDFSELRIWVALFNQFNSNIYSKIIEIQHFQESVPRFLIHYEETQSQLFYGSSQEDWKTASLLDTWQTGILYSHCRILQHKSLLLQWKDWCNVKPPPKINTYLSCMFQVQIIVRSIKPFGKLRSTSLYWIHWLVFG